MWMKIRREPRSTTALDYRDVAMAASHLPSRVGTKVPRIYDVGRHEFPRLEDCAFRTSLIGSCPGRAEAAQCWQLIHADFACQATRPHASALVSVYCLHARLVHPFQHVFNQLDRVGSRLYLAVPIPAWFHSPVRTRSRPIRPALATPFTPPRMRVAWPCPSSWNLHLAANRAISSYLNPNRSIYR